MIGVIMHETVRLFPDLEIDVSFKTDGRGNYFTIRDLNDINNDPITYYDINNIDHKTFVEEMTVAFKNYYIDNPRERTAYD